jgi:hypothetical protein
MESMPVMALRLQFSIALALTLDNATNVISNFSSLIFENVTVTLTG